MGALHAATLTRGDPVEKPIHLAASKVRAAPHLPIDQDDLLQVGRIAVWRADIDQAHPDWAGLVYRVARAAMIDEVRRFVGRRGQRATFAGVELTEALHVPDPSGCGAQEYEAKDTLAFAMSRLSPSQRQVLTMLHRGDSKVEIGRHFGHASGGYIRSIAKFAYQLMTLQHLAPRRAM